jgi:hypothetical protein
LFHVNFVLIVASSFWLAQSCLPAKACGVRFVGAPLFFSGATQVSGATQGIDT